MTDGCVRLLYYVQQLEIPSPSSSAAPVKATGTVRKRQARRYGPYVTCKITSDGSLSSSQPGGPPCWASPLTNYAKTTRGEGKRGVEIKRGGTDKERV
jgi:hypothetical protein